MLNYLKLFYFCAVLRVISLKNTKKIPMKALPKSHLSVDAHNSVLTLPLGSYVISITRLGRRCRQKSLWRRPIPQRDWALEKNGTRTCCRDSNYCAFEKNNSTRGQICVVIFRSGDAPVPSAETEQEHSKMLRYRRVHSQPAIHELKCYCL